MNKICLSGRLTKDIELKESSNNKLWCSNTIAVRREYKNANGEYDSDFINIVVYGNTAQYLKSYGSKGAFIEVVGRWQVRSYQAQDGTNKQVNECIVESLSVIQSKKEEQAQPTYQQPNYNPIGAPMDYADDEELPF